MKPPVYKISIDPSLSNGEDLGIEKIAFTKNPAIKVKGLAFNSEVSKSYFADAPKMRIAAPALIPMEIYRNDEDGEYYVEFTVEEIEQIHSKFMANLSNRDKFNLEHTEEIVPAYLLETWIVDEPLKDKAYSTYGIEVPKGTLMVVSQVTDKAYYDSLVADGQVGYSIEGFLGLSLSDLQTAKELINNNKQLNNNEMKEKEIEFKDVVLPEGAKFEIDGKKYIVVNGKVTEDISVPEVETPAEEVAPVEETPEEVVMAEVPVTDPTVPVTTPTLDEAAILAIIQPKLDEIYKAIADLKAEDDAEDVAEVDEEMMKECKMSLIDKFATLKKFNQD